LEENRGAEMLLLFLIIAITRRFNKGREG